jgi:hypothetical protein
MEERVRICAACGAVVGWFAQFCEACGARQAATAPAPSAGVGDAPGRDGRPGGGGAAVETQAPPEARTAAKDLFRAQLRLMHQVSEQAEDLIGDLRGVRAELAEVRRRKGAAERRERLAALSERLLAAEGSWDDLQRLYNRESEAAEEEWQEVAEGAQVDAYLTPTEEDAVAGEFTALHQKFEAAEAELRSLGRDLSLARREAKSSLFGAEASSRPLFWVSLVISLGLWAGSYQLAAQGRDPWRSFVIVAPALLGWLLMAVVAARRG